MTRTQKRSKNQVNSRFISLISISAAAFVVAAAASAETLIARPDNAQTSVDNTLMIDVLDNDSGVTNETSMSIRAFPENGVASITSDDQILYEPYGDFEGTDILEYRLRNSRSEVSKTTVTVEVAGGGSTQAGSVNLSWKPGEGEPTGYDVYYGPSPRSVDSKVKTVKTDSKGINPNNPTASFDPIGDLGADIGDRVCFALVAFNSFVESDFSEPVCARL
jgi:hypothetical protein